MKRIVMIIMAVALIALPTMAQEDQWQSTSNLQTSGSAYSSQINAVGATAVSSMATTTECYSPAKAPGGPRRTEINVGDFDGTDDPDANKSQEFPIGDALLPLLLMAMAFGMFIYFRRKRSEA